MFNVPVLLLTFNRDDGLDELIHQLKIAGVKEIYVASDGPRGNVSEECEVVNRIRNKIIKSLNWGCKVETLFRKDNLGCKLGVDNAIKWFFSQVKEGIVLEDDCIPSQAFLKFCSDMLKEYSSNHKVGTISGRNELSQYGKSSHVYSSKFFCWGWASWSNRIHDIDVEDGYKSSSLNGLLNGLSYKERNHLRGMRNLMLTKQVNSWAYSYDFWFRHKKQLHIIPKHNLVKNVGIGVNATHSVSLTHDAVEFIDSDITVIKDKEISKDFEYMEKYLRLKYSFLKIIIFPYIGYIKKLVKILKFN
jgi:hypothetical protein